MEAATNNKYAHILVTAFKNAVNAFEAIIISIIGAAVAA